MFFYGIFGQKMFFCAFYRSFWGTLIFLNRLFGTKMFPFYFSEYSFYEDVFCFIAESSVKRAKFCFKSICHSCLLKHVSENGTLESHQEEVIPILSLIL